MLNAAMKSWNLPESIVAKCLAYRFSSKVKPFWIVEFEISSVIDFAIFVIHQCIYLQKMYSELGDRIMLQSA